jgi:hypothetical protein
VPQQPNCLLLLSHPCKSAAVITPPPPPGSPLPPCALPPSLNAYPPLAAAGTPAPARFMHSRSCCQTRSCWCLDYPTATSAWPTTRSLLLAATCVLTPPPRVLTTLLQPPSPAHSPLAAAGAPSPAGPMHSRSSRQTRPCWCLHSAGWSPEGCQKWAGGHPHLRAMSGGGVSAKKCTMQSNMVVVVASMQVAVRIVWFAAGVQHLLCTERQYCCCCCCVETLTCQVERCDWCCVALCAAWHGAG